MTGLSPASGATTAGTIAGIVAVAFPGLSDNVKGIISAGVVLIIAVYTWQTHRTARNADQAAAQIATAHAVQAHAEIARPWSDLQAIVGTIGADVEQIVAHLGLGVSTVTMPPPLAYSPPPQNPPAGAIATQSPTPSTPVDNSKGAAL